MKNRKLFVRGKEKNLTSISNINYNRKRLIFLSIVSIILVFMLLLGSTYSLFTTTNIDENVNVYQTGVLDITYTLDDDNVSFVSKTPISEEEAKNIEPYRITITNDGTVDYKFNLLLVDTTATDKINYDYITTKVGKLESKTLSECPDNNSDKIIKSDIIVPAGESVDVDVKIWLNENTENSEIGKSFYGKLKVDGFAIYNDNEDIDNSVLISEYIALSGTEVGSYISYTGSNGCVGDACNGVDVSNAMVYSSRNVDTFSKNGWRILYKEGNNIYITTAGTPEYLCTSSDDTTSNSECSSYLDSSNLSTHITNLNNSALKYCNPTYAAGGVCDSSTTWNMNSNDFKKITENSLDKCYEVEGNTTCGIDNNLIDNGSLYWFSNINSTTNKIFLWDSESRKISNNNSNSLVGIRPVIKLDATVYIKEGKGSSSEPYIIEIPPVEDRTYNVSFDVNGGSGEFNDIEVKYDANYGELPTPTRTGYNFSGWYTDSSYTNKVTDTSEVELKHSHTLYAKWEAKTIYVYFDLNGGMGYLNSKKVTYSETYGELPTPERVGYIFDGWYTDRTSGSKITSTSIVNVEDEIILYARWSANTYTISYTMNNGTKGTYEPTSGTFDSDVIISNPSKTVTVTGNVNSTGATIGGATSKAQTFVGWSSSSSAGLNTTATSGTSANPTTSWTGSTTTNTYFRNLRSESGTVTLTANWTGVAFNLPTVSKTGYTCNWNTASDGSGTSYESGASYTPSSTSATAITMYARCSANTYTVSYYNGSTKINTSSHTYGTAKNLTTWSTLGATVTNSSVGWTFAGWSTANNNSTRNYTDGQSVNNLIETAGGNINLYAVYTRTITFKHGVSAASSSTVTQYWNPAGTTNGTHVSSVTSPSLTSVTNWTSSGFRDDTSAGEKEYDANASIYPATNGAATLYGVYTRSITFYSGVSKATNHGSRTQYLNSNSNTVSAITSYTPTTISNWSALGFRNDTTADVQIYGSNTSISPAYTTENDMYAVYSRTLTISYNGNSNTGGSTGNTTKTVYLNTNSTTTSSQAVTLAANGFSRTGHTFSKWAAGSASGTQYAASGSYTASIAYNASTFGVTMFAVWTVNTYTVTFYAQGGSTSTTSKTVTYGSTYGDLPESTQKGYIFNGWYTATSGGTKITSSSTVSITANQTLYAQWTQWFFEPSLLRTARNDSSINFSKTSASSRTNNFYVRNETVNDSFPIYYYRGNVDNNLIFAGFCWKIVRTTETGGVKLIYNGVPTDGTCDNTGEETIIGTKSFNLNSNSLAYVGYMYGDVYILGSKGFSNNTTSYVYGNNVSYVNGTYTLTGGTTSGAWSSVYNGGLNNYHYTCFTTGTTCTSVYYIYYTKSNQAYYVTLNGVANIETALSNMLDKNTTSSTIKGSATEEGTIDYWYANNISGTTYESYVEDTIWCNDRSIYSLGGWNPNGGDTLTLFKFSGSNRVSTTYKPDLTCARDVDKFTVSEANGNGDLTYPVGLLTIDEAMLAGGVSLSSNETCYLCNGISMRLGTPSFSYESVYMSNFAEGGYLTNTSVTSDLTYPRPAISLKRGFTVALSGRGTAEKPYVVK